MSLRASGPASKSPVNHLKTGDPTEVRRVGSGDGESFAQRDGGDQSIYLADQQTAPFEIRPDIRSHHRSRVKKGDNAMGLAELFKASKLGRRSDSFQATRHFVIAELREVQLSELCEVRGRY